MPGQTGNAFANQSRLIRGSLLPSRRKISDQFINKIVRVGNKDVVYRCTRAKLLKDLWRFVPSSPIIIFDTCSIEPLQILRFTYTDHTIYDI